MSAPPKTVLQATPEEAEAIRQAVRQPDFAMLGLERRRIATVDDAEDIAEFFSDPAVSDPIYALPRPFTVENVRDWIAAISDQQVLGEGLLVITHNLQGQVISYSKYSVWPDLSSAELGGAIRADEQNSGQGRYGMVASINWMFEWLGVRLIGLTAAPDNVRSAALLERAGFRPMGERDGVRPDGTVRRSLYWEMDRDAWREKWSGGG